MVHLLKYGTGKERTYLVLNMLPKDKDIRKLGLEHICQLEIDMKEGQYNPSELSSILREIKKEKFRMLTNALRLAC